MANLPEIVQYDDGIYQIETIDPVLGGVNGIANQQGKQLANRTAYLRKSISDILSGATLPAGVATQDYVQRLINLLDYKQSVRVATTANISLTGVQTIDGVAVIAGDRVLVKNQTSALQNGLYLANASTWARTPDADESTEVTSGLQIYVEEGTLQGKTRWQLTNTGPVIVGTTAIVFGDVTTGYAPLKSPALTDTPTTPDAAQFNTSGQIVNTRTMKAAGVQFSGVRALDLSVSNITLTLTDVGSLVVFSGSGGGSLTLPKANTVPAGSTVTVRAANTVASTNTLKVAAGDTLAGMLQATSPAGVMRSGDAVTCVSDGAASWYTAADTSYNFIAQAVAQLFVGGLNSAASGTQKLPGGLILQWGKTAAGSVPSGGQAFITSWPTSFPAKLLFASAVADVTGASQNTICASVYNPALSTIGIMCSNTAGVGLPMQGVFYFGIGI